MPSTAVLTARAIRKSFGRKRVLDGVDLEVARGEVVALVGENGAGKTTLLRICAGVLPADGGSVELGGPVGYCPQDPGVLDLLTADEHLIYFGTGLRLRRQAALDLGRRCLARLDFPDRERSTLARDLSAGTRQKLNLALALLGDPSILLLDEPYQGFDRGTYIDFWALVGEWRAAGRAIVVVTHMLAELRRVDRVIELTAGRARIATGDEMGG
jgi:ABC-2 type transport system ATP-binding protein